MTKPIISLKPSYNSVIRGCPGIPDTLPRTECELRIRSNDGRPFRIDKIEIILKTIESLHAAHSFSSKPKLEKASIHYKKNIKLSDNILIGIDIPLTIGLPDDIKETNYNTNFGKCTTFLECNVYYTSHKLDDLKSDLEVETYLEAINVERYSYLASKRLFPPLKRSYHSPDRKFKVNVTINNPCITNDDLLKVNLEVKQSSPSTGSITPSSQINLFNKKIKLKSIVYELKEYLEIFDATGTDAKENPLANTSQQVNEVFSMNSIKLKSEICVCTKSEYFKEFETTMQEPAFLYKVPSDNISDINKNNNFNIETKLLQNKSNGLIPFQYHTSITTKGKLFSINHVLKIKFKISSGRDFEIHCPIDISPWPLTQIKYIEQIINQERETAIFAKQFYESYGGIKRNKHTGSLEYPSLPPMVYGSDDKTVQKLSILYNTDHKNPKRIPLIE